MLVAVMSYRADAGVIESPNNVLCMIGGTVVHYDDFIVVISL